MVNGVDYELNGEVLTLKASYVAKLTESAALGEVAVLKAQFNKGADWTFHVLYNDTPVLQNVEGTTANFVIPTAFNGDRLATMEATYATGGNAGPNNWTSFKEFARTFKPTYATNEIALTESFFKEVNDGTVILKFHFWSGAIIEVHDYEERHEHYGHSIVEAGIDLWEKRSPALRPCAAAGLPAAEIRIYMEIRK